MKNSIVLIVLLLLTGGPVASQAGAGIDQEFIQTCLIDSLPDGTITRFTRLLLVGSRETIDVDDLGGLYTPTGTIMRCDVYDLSQLIRDPLADLYDNCQCVYTITQEDHFVAEIFGGATQEYVVEFQQVVRRQCTAQESQVVVSRDTLRDTTGIDSGFRLQYGFPFTAAGEYIDNINFRVYTGGTSTTTVAVDLNPSTVQASYPALTLNPNDFEYDGSNISDMVAAYLVVINHAVNQVAGTVVNPVTASGSTNQVNVFTNLQHQPLYPYVIAPRSQDLDYGITSTIPNNQVIFGQAATGLITRTENYTDECETIWTEQQSIYLTWDRLAPLSLLPVVNPVQVPRPGTSNPSTSCLVDPVICQSYVPGMVDVNGCVEECTEIDNIVGHLPISNEVDTLGAATYNSISIYVTDGPVQVSINGMPINYPTGWTANWSAAPRRTIKNPIIINASGGEAIISYVR